MTKQFNWRQALKDEEILKQQADIPGLLGISLALWNNMGSGHTYKERFPKICYYYGRLNAYDELADFLQNNQIGLEMWVDDKLRDISFKLCQVGANYEMLSETDISELNMLYSNPEYYDLLEDILFDFPAKYGELKKFDASIRKIKNYQFTKELKNEIFNCFLHNCDVEDFGFDKVYYYEKSSNSIVQKNYDKDIFRGVHYYIDFGMNIGQFAELVKVHFGNEFYSYYKEDMLNYGEPYDFAIQFSFNSYAYEAFEERLSNYIQNSKQEFNSSVDGIREKIAENWLLKVNSHSRNH